MPRKRKQCKHGRQSYYCLDCKVLGVGGKGICKHGRQRHRCKQCDGASICEHGRLRHRCKQCGGGGFCEHNKRQDQCSMCSPKGVFKMYKRDCARKRNLVFRLTLKQFTTIVKAPCYFCNEDTSARGVDRKDNSKGYVFENCFPCCGVCNHAKATMSAQAFIKHCQQVAFRAEERAREQEA